MFTLGIFNQTIFEYLFKHYMNMRANNEKTAIFTDENFTNEYAKLEILKIKIPFFKIKILLIKIELIFFNFLGFWGFGDCQIFN